MTLIILFVYWFISFLCTFRAFIINTRRVDGYLTIGALLKYFFVSFILGWFVILLHFVIYLTDLKIWDKKVFKK